MKNKIKVVVAVVLFLSVFLAGTVIILGHVTNYLSLAYFLFVLSLLGITIFSARNSFENRKDFALAFMAILLIAGFSVYFVDGARVYLNGQQSSATSGSLASELSSLSKSIENDTNQINYLQGEISKAQSNSIGLLGDMNALAASRSVATVVYQPPPAQPSQESSLAPVSNSPPATTNGDDYGRVRGGENDD